MFMLTDNFSNKFNDHQYTVNNRVKLRNNQNFEQNRPLRENINRKKPGFAWLCIVVTK